MKTKFLFPHQYKKIGWILFLGALLTLSYLWIIEYDFDDHFKITVFAITDNALFGKNHFFELMQNGILDEILTILIIVGALLVSFSKTKIEDELINKIRLESLALATYINYGFIILSTLFVYGFDYLNIVLFNLFTILIFFILIFHYKLAKLNQ
jgi:hypothetical protein